MCVEPREQRVEVGRGLIQRVRDTKDRRLVNVSATGKGLQVAKEAPSPLQDGLARGLQKLPAEKQATIARSLEQIVALMQATGIEASFSVPADAT